LPQMYTRTVRLALALGIAAVAFGQFDTHINPSPNRRAGEGDGPYDRLVIRGINVIDGTGAPARGPMDVVVVNNRIAEVRSVGTPGVPIHDTGRPAKGTREIDGTGMYLLPGFVDLHVHTGGAPKAPDAEYGRGFSFVEEMELLREAGFHPLEVIRSATLYGAQALHEPKGKPIDFGIVRPGLLADLVIVDQNPVENLKVLYGTGALKLNEKTGHFERVGGIKYTIKDGVVYDSKKLLADVAAMVERAKAKQSATGGGGGH
jgi:imidazolonepropionase-like amidohydrolase